MTLATQTALTTARELADHALRNANYRNPNPKHVRFNRECIELTRKFREAYLTNFVDASEGKLTVWHRFSIANGIDGYPFVSAQTSYHYPEHLEIKFERLLWSWQVYMPDGDEQPDFMGTLEECLAYVATYAVEG